MQQQEEYYCTIMTNQAPEYAEFGISEMIQLFQFYGMPHTELFKHNFPIGQVPAIKDITAKCFPTFPFIDVRLPNLELIQQVLSRAILIHDILITAARADSLEGLALTLLPQAEQYIYNPDISCKVDVVASGYSIDQKERVVIIDRVFGALKGTNKIDLSNPDITYYILTTKSNQFVIGYSFQKKHKTRVRNFARHYELPNRIYLGPTSLAHDIAFLMANQAQVGPNDFVLDPFSGTCGSLVACSHFGAICFGSEIDGYLLQGHCIGQINAKSTFYKEEMRKDKPLVHLNFKQYGLPMPNLVRTDVSYRNYSPAANGYFDAIICDPPYGIRAAIKQEGVEKDMNANRTAIYKQMFKVAKRLLRKGGRLVFLYPIWKETYKQIENEDGFDLIDYREQTLADKRSRLLVTMQRQ